MANMQILTTITWPDGTITSREIDFNNQDQRNQFQRIMGVALHKGGAVCAASVRSRLGAEHADSAEHADNIQEPRDYVIHEHPEFGY